MSLSNVHMLIAYHAISDIHLVPDSLTVWTHGLAANGHLITLSVKKKGWRIRISAKAIKNKKSSTLKKKVALNLTQWKSSDDTKNSFNDVIKIWISLRFFHYYFYQSINQSMSWWNCGGTNLISFWLFHVTNFSALPTL